ncbi:hypothetical protein HDU76_013252 [Blyttiomyces sp. JEL0837]|nr:hypothetical protein HDU76_013252 [Blyttiomyces sp. JEL0837]
MLVKSIAAIFLTLAPAAMASMWDIPASKPYDNVDNYVRGVIFGYDFEGHYNHDVAFGVSWRDCVLWGKDQGSVVQAITYDPTTTLCYLKAFPKNDKLNIYSTFGGDSRFLMRNTQIKNSRFALGAPLANVEYQDCNQVCYDSDKCVITEYDNNAKTCQIHTLVKVRDEIMFTRACLKFLNAASSSVVDKLGLTPCQYSIILQLTLLFETNTTYPDFTYCNNNNDGMGITAGFVHFTTKSGSILKVIENYIHDSNALPEYKTLLSKYTNPLSKIKDTNSTKDLDGFCNDWINTSTHDTATFHLAQLSTQQDYHLTPTTHVTKPLELKYAISMGQIMDTFVQSGIDVVRKLVDNVSVKSPAKGGDEVTWLNAYLDERVKYLNQQSGGDLYRVEIYQYIVESGNYNLGSGVSALDRGGNAIDVYC